MNAADILDTRQLTSFYAMLPRKEFSGSEVVKRRLCDRTTLLVLHDVG